ncbi:MAG: hypothetical protein AB1531_13060 [Chloroflexota bacterium]
MDKIREIALVISISLYVVLGLAGWIVFLINDDVAFKKRYFPWYGISMGILFGIFIIATGMMDFVGLVVSLSAIALITFMNIRMIKFCDSCGKTIINKALFSRVNYCSHCGAKLDD